MKKRTSYENNDDKQWEFWWKILLNSKDKEIEEKYSGTEKKFNRNSHWAKRKAQGLLEK